MPTEPREGDRLGNCRPGTVVDRTILVEQEFDFCKNEYNILISYNFQL
jgi:hypothetical protein